MRNPLVAIVATVTLLVISVPAVGVAWAQEQGGGPSQDQYTGGASPAVPTPAESSAHASVPAAPGASPSESSPPQAGASASASVLPVALPVASPEASTSPEAEEGADTPAPEDDGGPVAPSPASPAPTPPEPIVEDTPVAPAPVPASPSPSEEAPEAPPGSPASAPAEAPPEAPPVASSSSPAPSAPASPAPSEEEPEAAPPTSAAPIPVAGDGGEAEGFATASAPPAEGTPGEVRAAASEGEEGVEAEYPLPGYEHEGTACGEDDCGLDLYEFQDSYECATYETASGREVIGCLDKDVYESKDCRRLTFFATPNSTSPYANMDECADQEVGAPPEPPERWQAPPNEEPNSFSPTPCGKDDCGLKVAPSQECFVFYDTRYGTVRGCGERDEVHSVSGGACARYELYDANGDYLRTAKHCEHRTSKLQECGRRDCGLERVPEDWSCSRARFYGKGDLYRGRTDTEYYCAHPRVKDGTGWEEAHPNRTCTLIYDAGGNLVGRERCKDGDAEEDLVEDVSKPADQAQGDLQGGELFGDGEASGPPRRPVASVFGLVDDVLRVFGPGPAAAESAAETEREDVAEADAQGVAAVVRNAEAPPSGLVSGAGGTGVAEAAARAGIPEAGPAGATTPLAETVAPSYDGASDRPDPEQEAAALTIGSDGPGPRNGSGAVKESETVGEIALEGVGSGIAGWVSGPEAEAGDSVTRPAEGGSYGEAKGERSGGPGEAQAAAGRAGVDPRSTEVGPGQGRDDRPSPRDGFGAETRTEDSSKMQGFLRPLSGEKAASLRNLAGGGRSGWVAWAAAGALLAAVAASLGFARARR